MKAKSALFAFLLFLFCFSFAKPTFAANLLLNPSFEDVVGGMPTYWTKNVSTATLAISNTTKSGTQSASINKTNNSTGLIYAYQDIDIDTSSFYSLSGYTIKNDPKFSWIILRISWRDASSEISKTDSSQLTTDSPDFQQIKIDSVQPPNQAIKARIELAANIVSQNPNNSALFDDINFSQVEAPDQPTSTSTLIPTNTPTLTKTPTPSKVIAAATQTKTIQAVITSQKTANFAKITKEKQSSKSGALKVKEPSPKKSKEVKVLGAKDNNFSVIMVVGGLFLLIAGGSWFGLKIIKEKGLYDPFDKSSGS